MTHEEKKLLKENIFKLIIGVILLTTCFLHLQKNPAERIALYSGLKLVVQKIEILAYNVMGHNGELLEQKYKLEDQYLELIHLAEAKGCSDTAFLSELHQTYQNLLSEKNQNIEQYLVRYRILGSDFQNTIETNNCK